MPTTQPALQQRRSLLAVSLYIVGCCWTVAAFSLQHLPPRRVVTPIAMASASSEPSSSTTMDTTWRPISLADGATDIPTEWSHRPLWSESAFQSNLALYHSLTENSTDTSCMLSQPVQSALSVLHDALRLYQPCSVIVSFNGGKDAAVILYLTCAALAYYYEQHPDVPRTRPRAVYFDHPQEFPAVQAFTRECCVAHDVDLWAFARGTSFPAGLTALVEAHHPQPLAFVLGTRSGDPNAKGQSHFIPSSSSYMPPFLRVNPILEWTYATVWACLRHYQLPYCTLYDQGYTSLGTTQDTLPCPALRQSDGTYRPAYLLQDWSQERAGRIPKETKSVSKTTADEDTPSATTTTTTMALLIIGDEILKGFCNDTNTGTAARALQQQQHSTVLQEVAIVADTLEAIVPALQRLSQAVDIVITSGGVGPTHDDVTIQAVAAALPSPLVRHTAMAALIADKMPQATDAVVTKMATLPECAELRVLDGRNNNSWPILQCENIFVLPGVPQFFAEKMEAIAQHYGSQPATGATATRTTNDPTTTALYKVILGVNEVRIVDPLNAIVEQYADTVTIGSYPQMLDEGGSRTVLTLQGEATQVREAIDNLRDSLPDKTVVRVEEVDTENPKPRRLSLLEDD